MTSAFKCKPREKLQCVHMHNKEGCEHMGHGMFKKSQLLRKDSFDV